MSYYTTGLSGIRYNGYFDDNVNWFKTAPVHGDINNLTSIDNFTSNDDYYSWEWIGYFRANSNEAYTFYTYSDDASYLWLGNNALNGYSTANSLVNNGGLHGGVEAQGTSEVLVSGQYYPIRIQFGEYGGADYITVSFSTDTIPKTTDGTNYYYYKNIILNSLNLSGVYVGSNTVNRIYLGDTIVYEKLAITPSPTPTITPTITPTPSPTVTPTPTITPSPTPLYNPNNLVLVYDTSLQPANNTISVPIFGTSPSGTISWGDGNTTTISSTKFYVHTYATTGVYTVQVNGKLTALNYTVSSNIQQNKPKLSQCLSYGNIGITSLQNAFANCRNLSFIPSSLPTGPVTSIDYAFYDTTLNDSKMIDYWTPSSMSTLNGTFGYNTAFNQDITSWDTSNVTSTYETFRGATAFNRNISSWNMSSNTNMSYMFAGATSFNQNIGNWDVSQVTTLANAFDGATSFDQDLSNWNISGLNASSSLNNFMRAVTLNTSNYNSLLINWNTNKASYRTDLSPNFGSSKYTSAASAARSGLISYGWIITDGGLSS